MAIPLEQLQAQKQSTVKIDATTSKTTKLDFDRLKEKPRLCIKSNTDGGYGLMCSNAQYFLCCPNDGFSLIDKDGHEQKLNIKRDFSIYSICWSSYLQKFIILSVDQKIYTLDPNRQQLKMVKSLRENLVMIFCVCYEKTFVLWPSTIDSSIEIYDLTSLAPTDDESITKSLDKPIQILDLTLKSEEVDSIKQLCFSSDGNYLSIVTYFFDYCEHDSGYVTMFQLRASRHDGNEKLEKKIESSIWNSGSWLIALLDEKFLVRGRSEGDLILMDYSTSTASINNKDSSNNDNRMRDIEETIYNIQSGILKFAICGNCLAIEGLEGEIRFYDL